MGALGTLALVLSLVDRFGPKPKTPRRRALDRDGRGANDAMGQLDDDGTPGVPSAEKARFHRVRSIEDRLRLIRQLVVEGGKSPAVRSLTHSFLNRKCGDTWCVPEKDQPAEIAAIFAEVRRRVRYTLDPLRRDTYVTPDRTLFTHMGGDCDDSAAALGACLESVGYPVRLRVVQTTGNDSYNHIYLVVQMPATGQWIALDPSQDKPAGWEVPKHMVIKKMDFEV